MGGGDKTVFICWTKALFWWFDINVHPMLMEGYSKSKIRKIIDQRKWRFIGDYNKHFETGLNIFVCVSEF